MFAPAFFGLLLAASVTGQHVEISPREAVRRVGDDLEVLCKVSYPIDSCRFQVGQTTYRLKPEDQNGDVVYHGQGWNFGECGAHIKRIREEWNGNISCNLPPQSGAIELSNSMRLLVAKAPGVPQLFAPREPVFREGQPFEAQCIVPEGRPAAKIIWLLDNDQLLVGPHQPIIETIPGTDLQTIRQNLSRVLTAGDAGKTLVCRALHEAIDGHRDATIQLNVQYPPKVADGESNQLTIFGLKIGEEGRLNVTLTASPPPRVEWSAGEAHLTAPGVSEDGRLRALEPSALGGGRYNVTLVLARVEKEDVDRVYYLRASNELGREEVMVRISTMDEPAAGSYTSPGVELDAGAIVGIVIGILVLLIAVFLVVFAKATDRWCFAGGRERNHAKSSGESSDTESAVGGHGAGAARRLRGVAGAAGERLAALRERVLSALPRRDRVQATTAGNDEEKPSEEKKGVVYAELALGEVPTGDKPPPPATEYAEIVYSSEQGQKEAKE